MPLHGSSRRVDPLHSSRPTAGHQALRRSIGNGSFHVAIDGGDNIFVAGNFVSGVLDFGGTASPIVNSLDYDLFAAKLDPNGVGIWAKRFGDVDASYSTQNAALADEAGNFYLTGRLTDPLDFGCGEQAVVGDADGYIAKLDTNGVCQWATTFPPGAGFNSRVYEVDVQSDGTVIAVGEFIGSLEVDGSSVTSQGVDGFVSRLDPDTGEVLRTTILSGPLDDAALSVHRHGTGAVVSGRLTGTVELGGCELTIDGDQVSAFVAQLDQDGSLVASKILVGDARATAVLSNESEILVFGDFLSALSLDGQAVISADASEDVFIASFTPR